MCGIAGLIAPDWHADRLGETVRRMTDAIRYRGPDAEGHWCDAAAGVALGHRRLAIQDLSEAGRQPMLSPTGRYVVIYNGEIYNHHDLRPELEAAGHRFRGTSDTETMLAGFESWGIADTVARLVGMFALAVWDRERRELHLLRDRYGIKPLYWWRYGDGLRFASELAVLRVLDDEQRQIDPAALNAFFRWGYVPAPASIYAGIAKLPAGGWLTFGPDGTVRQERFWDLARVVADGLADPLDPDPREAVDAFERLLHQAVSQRMLSDVPLGALLSGGIDSSVVVAQMQASSSRPVRTFAIGFEDPRFDEAPHARAIAGHLGTDHTELYIDEAACRDLVPDVARLYDEPFADSSQIPTVLVSRLTRRHVTVALTGDGGDEQQAGYSRYLQAERLHGLIEGLPAPLAAGLRGLLSGLPGPVADGLLALALSGQGLARGRERAERLRRYLLARTPLDFYRVQHALHFRPSEFVAPGFAPDDPLAVPPCLDETAAGLEGLVDRFRYWDSRLYLADDVLTKVDRASMSVALEARVPLLDHRLSEWIWRLPPGLLRHDGRGKWLLRQVLSRHVPPALWDRPKQGFAVPVAGWLDGPLKDWAESLLSRERLAACPELDPAGIRRAWKEFGAGRLARQHQIWSVLAYLSWREVNLG